MNTPNNTFPTLFDLASVRSADVSPQRSFYWAGFIFPGLTSGGWASAYAVGGVFGVGSEVRVVPWWWW